MPASAPVLARTSARYLRDNYLRLGTAEGLERGGSVGIDADFRGHHVYIVGQTGTGKSRLIENLITQDIHCWADQKRGLVLIDPHGSICDGVLGWLAEFGRRRYRVGEPSARPIVPLDFHAADHVPIYNPLRWREGANPNVIVDHVAQAIAYAWGAADLHATPRLASWLRAFLLPLYVNRRPLAEVLRLKRDVVFREQMLRAVTDPLVLDNWRTYDELRPAQQVELTESTFNRLGALVSDGRLQQVFGPGPSFDFQAAMDEGQIVLVNLAKTGGRLSGENAAVLQAMLFADLWQTAAFRAEKRERPKPFYVYCDEFQTGLSPAIATALNEARGYGLHLTLAHQNPSQLLAAGAVGEQIFNSVLGNAWTKICFRQQLPDDVRVLARLMFQDLVDPDEIKHKLYSLKVVGQEARYLPTWRESQTVGEGGSTSHSSTATRGETGGGARAIGEAMSEAEQLSQGQALAESLQDTWAETTTDARARARGTGTTAGEGGSEQFGHSVLRSRSQARSASELASTSKGESHGRAAVGRSEMVSVGADQMERFFTEDDGDLKTRSFGEAKARGTATTAGTSEGEASTHGGAASWNRGSTESFTLTDQQARALAQGGARGQTTTSNQSRSQTQGRTASVVDTTNWGWSASYADSVGHTSSWSESTTTGVSHAPVLFSVFGHELASITYRTVEEQLELAGKMLVAQDARYFVARIMGVQAPIVGRTLDTPDALAKPAAIAAVTAAYRDATACVFHVDELPEAEDAGRGEDDPGGEDEPQSFWSVGEGDGAG